MECREERRRYTIISLLLFVIGIHLLQNEGTSLWPVFAYSIPNSIFHSDTTFKYAGSFTFGNTSADDKLTPDGKTYIYNGLFIWFTLDSYIQWAEAVSESGSDLLLYLL